MLELIYDVGIDIVLAVQDLGNWLITPMESVTFLGTEEFYLLLLPAIYWCIDTAIGVRVGLILLLSGSINTLFKWVLHMPRPYWYSAPVDGMAAETGFGAPSGHSQIPSSIFGLIAVSIRRRWATVLLLTLIFLIGFSRLFLGVHFPHDVLIGWLLGGLILWGFLKYEAPVKAWFVKRNAGRQIAALAIIAIVILLIGIGILSALSDFTVPQEWVTNAVADQTEKPDPLNLNSLINPTAAFFGLGTGVVLLKKVGNFDPTGPTLKRIVRYILGVIGVVVIWMGLGEIFPRDATVLSYSLRFIRYALVALWISYIAPWFFVRIGLAQWQSEA